MPGNLLRIQTKVVIETISVPGNVLVPASSILYCNISNYRANLLAALLFAPYLIPVVTGHGHTMPGKASNIQHLRLPVVNDNIRGKVCLT